MITEAVFRDELAIIVIHQEVIFTMYIEEAHQLQTLILLSAKIDIWEKSIEGKNLLFDTVAQKYKGQMYLRHVKLLQYSSSKCSLLEDIIYLVT